MDGHIVHISNLLPASEREGVSHWQPATSSPTAPVAVAAGRVEKRDMGYSFDLRRPIRWMSFIPHVRYFKWQMIRLGRLMDEANLENIRELAEPAFRRLFLHAP